MQELIIGYVTCISPTNTKYMVLISSIMSYGKY